MKQIAAIPTLIGLLFYSAGSTASTFWPEQGKPLTRAQLAALNGPGVVTMGEQIVIDDQAFPIQRLLLSGFSARPWPSGRLYYEFAPGLSKAKQTAFLKACSWWQAVSSVKCVKRNSEAGYLRVQSVGGNTSTTTVGYTGGRTYMYLCCSGSIGHVAHELGHALGATHEHQRTGRNAFVRIHYENLTCCRKQFDEVKTSNYGTYDFRSIMHYPGNARARKGTLSIEVMPPNQALQKVLGQRRQLSALDGSGMKQRYQNVR
jgi:hypothetical protein